MVVLEILILISAISVALAPALIRSALFLMLTFLLSGLFIAMIGAEIMALLFLLVYIGAISVLFLFVVMLLQLTKNQVNQFYILETLEDREEHPTSDVVFSIITGIFILLFIYLIFLTLNYSFPLAYIPDNTLTTAEFQELLYENSEVHNLGTALFIDHWFAFIMITLIIIMASFGVIIILK